MFNSRSDQLNIRSSVRQTVVSSMFRCAKNTDQSDDYFFDHMSEILIISRMYNLKIFSHEFFIRTLLFILYNLRKYKRQLGIYTIFR